MFDDIFLIRGGQRIKARGMYGLEHYDRASGNGDFIKTTAPAILVSEDLEVFISDDIEYSGKIYSIAAINPSGIGLKQLELAEVYEQEKVSTPRQAQPEEIEEREEIKRGNFLDQLKGKT